MLDGTHVQLWHLMRGLFDVIPSHLISVFDYQVCGVRVQAMVCIFWGVSRCPFCQSRGWVAGAGP